MTASTDTLSLPCCLSLGQLLKSPFCLLFVVMWFSQPQVNGMNVDGLRHSEVVALIKAGGEEVRLLVVDLETDELFLRLGLPPNTSPGKGEVTTH